MSEHTPGAGVTLLHTNDLHSHLEQTARIAGYIKNVRSSVESSSLLVVDCGDFLDRSRPETEGTYGMVNRRLMDAIGYDAVVLGNNEGLTYTADRLDGLYDASSCPVVCANFRPLDPARKASWLVPSLKLERGGLTVGFIGLTAAFNDYYRLLGWHAADPIETAREWAAKLRPEVDALIVLSHLGIRLDERLAASVDGIDVILGGHTHHLLEKPLRIGHTAICAAGKFGSHIGHLRIDKDGETGRVAVSGGCVSMDAREADREALAIISDSGETAREKMSRTVAELAEPIHQDVFEESPLSTLLASAIRRRTGAEIGIVNSGQLLAGFPQGKVTEADVHAVCPSPINPCTMVLSGEELLHTLEQSLLPEYRGLEIRGFGFRGKWLGGLCMDGLQAAANLSLPAGRRITDARVNGEALQPRKDYVVATLDMFTFGVGYEGLQKGRDVRYFLPEFIRDVLAEALGDREKVADCRNKRWQISGTIQA